MSILNCPCCNLSWQHFVLIPMGKRNVFPSCLWQPFMYLETVIMRPRSHLFPRLNAHGSCGPSAKPDPRLFPRPRRSLSIRPHLSRNTYPVALVPSRGLATGSCLLLYVPVGCLPFPQQHGIDFLIYCTTGSLFVKGLASQQVPVLHFHG